ncbi:MAG TPA: hypothetical protein VLV32_01795 [Burkholderiales bacterium]|nr:hypothetical protein [Burkholderiales bacterium]
MYRSALKRAPGAILMLALLQGAGWAENPVREVKSYSLGAAQIYTAGGFANAAYGFSPTLVFFASTGWRKKNIFDAVKTTAKILSQCGIEIQGAQLHLLDAPERFKYYDTPVSRELARLAPFPKPTVYFVKDTLQVERFDAEAIGRANSRTRPELRDTIWIAFGVRDLGISLAHELAHVLMNSGEHVDEPENLMRDETTPRNTKLDSAQCERMRREGGENGLLKPLHR